MKSELTSAVRHTPVPRPPRLRSRVTNGRSLFAEGGDMRGPWARRLRDVFDAHVADLGGTDRASEAERSILRRASTLTVELERIEARFAVGEGTGNDLDLYQRTAGNLQRLLESVGLDRRQRDATPTLAEYLAARAEKADERGEDTLETVPANQGAAESSLASAPLKPIARPSS